ncbi:MAG: choice-of-anchor Q domain-containing protein, partial [Kiritimatiellae bacterium]|nr:choice-of-anchor Q domain-containing protein [Kiritimatiellia bacterium]
VWMNAGWLIGFTITNGATLETMGGLPDVRGGGVYCELTATPVISNCFIAGNSAGNAGNMGSGGGVFCGTVIGCLIVGNSAPMGLATGAGGGTSGYQLGTTVYYFPVINSIITGNIGYSGAGTYRNHLTNCLVTGNNGFTGGGYGLGDVNNCTIVDNKGNQFGTSGGAGGIYGFLTSWNSIVYFNTGSYPNFVHVAGYGVFSNCCAGTTIPASMDGGGNTTADPKFLDRAAGNYRLKFSSPCVNTGTNQAWMATARDLDGTRRVLDGRVDMGAYEWIPLRGTVVTLR